MNKQSQQGSQGRERRKGGHREEDVSAKETEKEHPERQQEDQGMVSRNPSRKMLQGGGRDLNGAVR